MQIASIITVVLLKYKLVLPCYFIKFRPIKTNMVYNLIWFIIGLTYQHKRSGKWYYCLITLMASLKLIQTRQIKETLFDLYQNAKYIPRYI